jgi:membrane-associated phospholipid phosphatase
LTRLISPASPSCVAVRVDEVLRSTRSPLLLRLLNAAWFAVIVYSTLAIKQHVVWDVAAGALLGLIFVLPSLRWRPGRESPATSAAGLGVGGTDGRPRSSPR